MMEAHYLNILRKIPRSPENARRIVAEIRIKALCSTYEDPGGESRRKA